MDSTSNNHHSTTASSTITGAGIRWDSPLPYLFGGIAIVLGLITMALIILACSSDKHSEEKDKEGSSKSLKVVDDGPKFVVIMAGADKPTFLAKPMPKPKPKSVIMHHATVTSGATTIVGATSTHCPSAIELV